MSEIWLHRIAIQNFRSFGKEQEFFFPDRDYGKPVTIVGYNNSGKTTLINAIRYGIGDKYLSAKTLERKDLHHLHHDNNIKIETRLSGSSYEIIGRDGPFDKTIGGEYTISTSVIDNEIKSSCKPSFFGANKHYNIFYINFHKIKEEISTKKTSWGNLTSFLAKHIQKIVEKDPEIIKKKDKFKSDTKQATKYILDNSKLKSFISSIKENYSRNLRNNNCEVEFVFPDYNDVFLQMIFKVGLDGNTENLLPVDHFGDGYISMFVMAIIQAIAETEIDDKCLFLFEEPESFLHENHQEYFYKMVLCNLSKKGHQVIYTTHSDKMVDIFDTQSIIRLEYDDESKSTIQKYNKSVKFSSNVEDNSFIDEPLSIENFNSYIKSVEPNLNKILFSKKVLLVEGPNDLMSYRYAIEKILSKVDSSDEYNKCYLNFLNISIIVHHGKLTAILLIDLCKHFGLDYFIINDWDMDDVFIDELKAIESKEELKKSDFYKSYRGVDTTRYQKGNITSNWRLLKSASEGKIHFNIPKLEGVLKYDSDDKDSLKIFQVLQGIDSFPDEFIPQSLLDFLEIDTKEEAPTFAAAPVQKYKSGPFQPVSLDDLMREIEDDDNLPF